MKATGGLHVTAESSVPTWGWSVKQFATGMGQGVQKRQRKGADGGGEVGRALAWNPPPAGPLDAV